MTSPETLIENDLYELLGGQAPPDLIERTLARLSDAETTTNDYSDLGLDAQDSAHVVPLVPARLLLLRRFAVAACALLALGVMAWLVWPQTLPESVTAATAASYRVKDNHIELKSGWLLLTDGAPEVRVDNGRVNDVQGRAVVGTGIPNAEALDALAVELGLSDTEKTMLKLPNRWLTAGGLALCLLTGQAVLNDRLVQADDLPAPEVKEDKPEVPDWDDIEGVRKLMRSSVRVEVMVDGRRVIVDELTDVQRITEALSTDGFATSDKQLTWDPWDGVSMFLQDGSVITTSGLSWEEDVYEMALPGMKGSKTYTLPAGAHDVLRNYFKSAKQRTDVKRADDFSGIRDALKHAVSVSVHGVGPDTTGESTAGSVIAEFANTLFADGTDMSKSYLFGDRLLDFEFKIAAEESIKVALDIEGIMSLTWPNGTNVTIYAIDATRLDNVKSLAAELVPSQTGFRVLRKWTGADCAITEKRCEIVTDAKEWAELWAEHMAPELMDPPVLDFDKELVVAVFGGQGFNSKGYFAQEILKARTGWVIRVDETTYQTANGADNVSPYGIWVVPADGGSIVVEENVQSLKNRAPLWRSIGYRVATEDQRENLAEYQPSHTITGAGGPGSQDSSTEFLVVRNLNEWHAALNRIDDDSAQWPDPDFSNEIAVVAFGRRFSARGNFVLDVWGESPTTLFMRIVTPSGQTTRNATNIFGLWVMKRPALDVAIESPSYGAPGTPAMWEPAFVAKRSEEPFGIYDDQYGTTDDADSLYLLIESQAELEKHVDEVQQDWVDWSTESVVLLRHGRKSVWVGMEASVENGTDSHVLTYHLTAPSGVVADPINQYLVLKVKKPTATLVIKQRLKTGPAPADVKEVARFEK